MKFKVARIGVHMWEEPSISGDRGSGTVFFSGCVMKCCYCQNYEISHQGKGVFLDNEGLTNAILRLQDKGVHNINLVTPTHYIEGIAGLLDKIKGSKLIIPVVYNTGSYESVEQLRLLDGLVDIYLPDLKYYEDDIAKKYSKVDNYYEIATQAIAEMRRQQKEDIFSNDIMTRGVIVRHLALPNMVEDSKKVLDYISSLDKSIYVSLMGQYFPTPNVNNILELNRRLTKREYQDLIDYFFNIGLKNGYMQDLSSAIVDYVPSFDLSELSEYI